MVEEEEDEEEDEVAVVVVGGDGLEDLQEDLPILQGCCAFGIFTMIFFLHTINATTKK